MLRFLGHHRAYVNFVVIQGIKSIYLQFGSIITFKISVLEDIEPVLPTLGYLLEHLLELESKLQELRKKLNANLEVNRPWPNYLTQQSFNNNTQQLQQEIYSLDLLVADCKTTIMEFIPTFFKSVPVVAYGHQYVIGKYQRQEDEEPYLVIRQKGYLE